jgi:hypothetical protein
LEQTTCFFSACPIISSLPQHVSSQQRQFFVRGDVLVVEENGW